MSSIHERFEIHVPAGRVYEALSQPERIVGALPGVSSIYRFADNHYRVDIGAAGRSHELDLEVTERIPGRRIAWRSRDGRWTGSTDVESLGADRSLVIVEVNDNLAASGAGGEEDAAVVDAALRALKQALEAAATQTAGGGADADDVRVNQRARGERYTDRDSGAEREPYSRDERWNGSRGFFPGSDQAMAMVRSLSREMDKLWEQVMRRAAGAGRGASGFMGGWMPPVDMCEQDDEICIRVDVPGIAPEHLHVEVDPGLLVIRGERRAEPAQGNYARSERMHGAFVRRIPLPEGLRTEETRAKLRHGVLEVRIPVPALRRAREVPIDTSDTEHSA